MNIAVVFQNVLGRSSAIVYGVALLASGQSSSITGTYAGQYIMQGFLDIKMKKWVRNLMTRSIAIVPSLVVSIIGGSSGAGRLIIIASVGTLSVCFHPTAKDLKYRIVISLRIHNNLMNDILLVLVFIHEDDTILRATVRPHPSSQVQQQ
jgi:hypothetical protein